MKIILVSLICLAITSLKSQIFVFKNVSPIPNKGASLVDRLAGNTAFGAEFGRGIGSAGDNRAWELKINGMVEAYRFGPESGIVMLFGNSLNANDNNDLGLNPRGSIWEEAIAYFWRSGVNDYYISYFHRCKHDLDNTDHPDGDLNQGHPVQKRNIVLSGLQFAFSSGTVFTPYKSSMQYGIRTEVYLISGDYRDPKRPEPASWDRMHGGVHPEIKYEYFFFDVLKMYLKGRLSAMIKSASPLYNEKAGIETNYRIETGLNFIGRASYVDLFLGYERLFDDVTYIIPTETDYFHLGMRFRGFGLE